MAIAMTTPAALGLLSSVAPGSLIHPLAETQLDSNTTALPTTFQTTDPTAFPKAIPGSGPTVVPKASTPSQVSHPRLGLAWVALSLATLSTNASSFAPPANDSGGLNGSLDEPPGSVVMPGNLSNFGESGGGSMGNKTCLFDPRFLNMSSYEYDYRTELWRDITWKETIKISLYVVVFLIAVTGNLLVILVVYFNTNLWSSTNRYLVNLAIADLLVALCCTWVHLVRHLASPNYVLPAFVCRLDSFLQATTLSASVLTLTAISVGRFVAVMFPLRTHTSPDRAYRVIVLIWLSSAMLASPMLLYRQLYSIEWANFQLWQCDEFWPMEGHYDEQQRVCVVTADHKKLFYTFFTIAIYFLPATIMVASYSLVVWRLWASQLPGEHCPVSRLTVTRSKKKVVKMVTVVVVVFIICWTPLQSLILYSNFSTSQSELPEWFSSVEYVSYFIAHANSAINPIIYCSFNSSLRRGLLALLTCRHNKRGSFYQRRTNWKGMTAGTRETTFGVSGVDPAVLQANTSIRNSKTRLMVRTGTLTNTYRSRPQQVAAAATAVTAAAAAVAADAHAKERRMTVEVIGCSSSGRDGRQKLHRNSSAYSMASSTASSNHDCCHQCLLSSCCSSCGGEGVCNKKKEGQANNYDGIYCNTANDVVPDIAKAGGSCINLYAIPPKESDCPLDGWEQKTTCHKVDMNSKSDSIDVPSGLSYEMITHGEKVKCKDDLQAVSRECESNDSNMCVVENIRLSSESNAIEHSQMK